MNRVRLMLSIALAAVCCAADPGGPLMPQPILHVAVDGRDAWSGLLPEPSPDGRDGPLRSVERALAVRRAAGPAHGAAIELHAGDHVLARGLRLGAEDSGQPGRPLRMAAHPGDRVRLLGGVPVGRLLRPLRDPAILARLPAAARAQVLELDLQAAGLSVGVFHSYGFNRGFQPSRLELYWDGRVLPMASWPKQDGFEHIAGFPAAGAHDDEHGSVIGALAGGFLYAGDRPAGWTRPQEILIHGYWAWDWANSVEQVESIDAAAKLIRLGPPYGHYGYRTGNRVQYRNVLEELSEPGEWFLDGAAQRLYVWPPGDPATAQVVATALEDPLIHCDGASDVVISDLALAYGRGHGVLISGGREVRIEHCELRDLGGSGIQIAGGTGHAAVGNLVHDTGHCGIQLDGGDRRTLAPAGHLAEGNHVHHVARRTRCYAPAIGATGVGIRIAGNLMHDHPHTAVLFWGNDIVIERNEIHDVCLETGDAGAIYIGRDYSFRGNVVRGNFVHHLGGVGMGTMGMYNDDCVSGTRMEGNVFWKMQRAVFLGGGRDFIVENNLFVDCEPAIELDGRGLDGKPVWSNMVRKTMRERLEAMDYLRPPYSARYPELAALAPIYAAGAGVPPGNIRISRNVCVGGRWFVAHWGATADMARLEGNYVGADPGFADAAKGDFRLPPGAAPFALGYTAIPFAEIGLAGRSVGPR